MLIGRTSFFRDIVGLNCAKRKVVFALSQANALTGVRDFALGSTWVEVGRGLIVVEC
jgi:hypothetical protein